MARRRLVEPLRVGLQCWSDLWAGAHCSEERRWGAEGAGRHNHSVSRKLSSSSTGRNRSGGRPEGVA